LFWGQGFSESVKSTTNLADMQNVIRKGEMLRENGSLSEAQTQFDLALADGSSADKNAKAAALIASGYNLFLLNTSGLAEKQLIEGYQLAKVLNPYLHALAAEYLGSLYLSQSAEDKARQYFNEALQVASASTNRELEASILLLKLSVEDVDTNLIADRISALPSGYAKAKLQLQWAERILDFDLSDLSEAEKSKWIEIAYNAISESKKYAELENRVRFQAEATASLAELYYRQGRYDDAINLTNEGLAIVQANANELVIKLNKIKGDAFKRQKNLPAALAAYDISVKLLDKIKDEIPLYLTNGKSSVDTIIDPVYRAYVDVFLRSSVNTDTPTESTYLTAISKMEAQKNHSEPNKLLMVINRMEAVKNADLQSFFLDRCSDALDAHSDWANQFLPAAVVLYPIIFEDRTELITKKGDVITRHVVNIPSDELLLQVENLIYALKNGKNYEPSATQLHKWLIQPILNEIKQSDTKTIVYVPDRAIRGLPLAALFDGSHFVVEQHAIVTLPSLALKNLYRSKSDKVENQTLIAGLSKPDGPSIDNLPKNIINNLAGRIEEENSSYTTEKSIQETRSKLVTALSLPSVEEEVNEIGNLTKTQPLLNQKFTADAFKNNIESANFGTVHIASHGYFGKNVKDSFIMAYDKNLNLQDFENSLNIDKLKQNPIDLLALSACETAESNDRMILGFSGLAVKSNALSAVGSLWSINDQAALQLMRSFYVNLIHAQSKSLALQQAQISMIKSKKYNHPYYWSPFVLIGNWH